MSVLSHAWGVCDRLGLAPTLRKCYLAFRTAPNGWTYRARVGDHDAVFTTKTWLEFQRVRTFFGEGEILASLLDDIGEDDTVWDVGANVGLYSCFVAKTLGSGAVVAFEPEPNNLARLESNLGANAPPERWLTCPVALSDEDGPGWLASAHRPSRRTEAGAGHHYLSDSPPVGAALVTCRRGETLVEEGVPAPDVLKIDVQGAEERVLRGMGDLLQGVDVMYLELHPEKCERYGTSTAATERFLRDSGYTLTDLGRPSWNRSGVYHVRATRED